MMKLVLQSSLGYEAHKSQKALEVESVLLVIVDSTGSILSH